MVRRGGRGLFLRFRGSGRRPYNDRDTQKHDTSFDDNSYQTNNYSDLPVATSTNTIIQGINDLHLGNVVEKPSTLSPAPVSQQQPQTQRRRKQPTWTIEEEVKLVNYVCNNYELLSNNKRLFWREFGKNSEKILHYPRFADSCKTKFYSLVARYRQNVDLYDAIERYLDLEESSKHVSQNIEESFSITSTHSAKYDETTSNETQTPIISLSKASRDETFLDNIKTSCDETQMVALAKSSMETNIDQDSREVLPCDTFNTKHDDSHVSGTTSPINDPSSENSVIIIPRNASQAATFFNYSITSNSSTDSYNDFPSFIESIRQQIVSAQDYLNREKTRAENHVNSLDSVLHLFTQLEDQLQKMR